ncbi:MAG: outer membrane beta-barrel protein [Ignavibacteria bacterium]|jgi:hypothetical protein|nr:outer membrane beta-barrel protein [Ignavibacteria bacterium]
MMKSKAKHINKPLFSKTNKQFAWIILILVFCFSSLLSQKSYASNDTKNSVGREFWICFQKNFKESKQSSSRDSLQLELFISGDKDARVIIEIKGIGYKNVVDIKKDEVLNIPLPKEAQVLSSDKIEQLAVYIKSDNPITVYGLNRRFQTTDSFLCFPMEVLGKEYRAMAYYVSDGLMSQFAIVATEDNTDVNILPSVHTSNHLAEQLYTVKLNKGEVYQVVAKNDNTNKCDLTGSIIKANKKIAVFSGHQCAYVPQKILACNHLIEQMPPVPSWGKHFYIGKLQGRSFYTYRVLANETDTRIFEDDKLVATLKNGEFYENNSDQDIQVTADKPVLVAQYSQGFKNSDSIGDPMMIMVSPTQQFLKHYRFATPVNGQWRHYINVVSPTNSVNTILLNGKPVDTTRFELLGKSRYSIACIEVPFGTHIIQGAMPFGMYSYGFGFGRDSYDAYGTMAGQSFVDYQPAEDVLAPIGECEKTDSYTELTFWDDRDDDTGILSVKVLENEYMIASIPEISAGAPRASFKVTPQFKDASGRIVFQVLDIALNKSVFTLCYLYDLPLNRFIFKLSEGNVENCSSDGGWYAGGFLKLSANMHSASFSSSGNLISNGNFSNSAGVGGFAGLYLGRRVGGPYILSARLSLENYGGTIESPDSISSKVRTETGELKTLQEARTVTLDGLFLNLNFACEYYLNPSIYLLGGLNLGFSLSSAISAEQTILSPSDFAYQGDVRSFPLNLKNLNSMNKLRLGAFAGLGFTVPIHRRFNLFTEVYYNHSLSNIIDDGTWKIHNLSFQLGARFRVR